MLKFINLVLVLVLSSTFNDLRSSQLLGFGHYPTTLGKPAEELLYEDERMRRNKIEKLQTSLNSVKKKLSLKGAPNLLNVVARTIWSTLAMYNLCKRDILENELYNEKQEQKKEQLIEQRGSEDICKTAFENPYFSKWRLIEDDRKTQNNKIVHAKVQMKIDDKVKSFWRTSKICIATNQNNEKFIVYLSAQYKFSWGRFPVFVFLAKPSHELSTAQRLLFWQHVVTVDSFFYYFPL